jgi:two-component system nitrogen regulation sensor histidine kinase NtrY
VRRSEIFHKLSLVARWEVAIALQCGAVALWLETPSLRWATAAVAFGLFSTLITLARRRFLPTLVALLGLSAAFTTFNTSWRVRAVETRWPDLREGLIENASEELDISLENAVQAARALADSAIGLTEAPVELAFRRLERALIGDGPEKGVVLLDSSGQALAWSGRHRLAPLDEGPELAARITPFYVLLEARRQTQSHTGVGQVLLAADSAVPDRGGTLAEQFVRRTGAALVFHEPVGADAADDLFDYILEIDGAPDTLFSVRTLPPDQGTFKLQLEARGARWATWLTLATLVALVACGPAVARWLGIVAATVLLVSTPAGVDLGQLFSAATYYLDALGPVTASAGSLLVMVALCLVVLVPVSRRSLARRRIGVAAAVVLVVSGPYALAYLAGGITPPASAIGLGLWLGWETTLALCGAVLIMAATLLLRGDGSLVAPQWVSWLASGWAVGLAVLGLVIWEPVTNWPFWYGVLWLPAVLLAVIPVPRSRMVVTAAVVSGAAAAALTWSVVAEGRLLLAERDAARASEGDPELLFRLDNFDETMDSDRVPESTALLYRAWSRSLLSADDYPAVLASWGPDGQQLARLDLAQLGLSDVLLQAIAHSARASIEPHMEVVIRPPSLYVEAVPFGDGSVVTIGVGPRSRLIEPVRLARFLRGERRLIAPYTMVLSEPRANVPPEGHLSWRRQGWTVLGDLVPVIFYDRAEPIELPGGPRHLHVQLHLSSLGSVLVRGALLVFWNMLLITLLWFSGEALSGKITVPPLLQGLLQFRSYRSRLTIALAGFFVLPTLGYAAWSFTRIQADAVRNGDLLIQQTLSDAMPTARVDQWAATEAEDRLSRLTDAVNADLLWYDGGVLTDASPGVLSELGLVDAYMPSQVYRQLVLGDAQESTEDVSIAGRATRVGYRNLSGFGISGSTLAVPRLVDVLDILSDQEDLLYVLALATLIGLGAAVMLAGAAARSLAYPVRSLRTAAVAVGRGESLPPFEPDMPTEFVPVVEAFERMAHDVESSQSALETARRRTAAVLRNVATGVVAVDRDLRVTIANPRAEQFVGAPLPAGAHVYAPGGREWAPVWEWLRAFINNEQEAETREFVVGAQHIRAHAAAISGTPGGCVLALDDTTELTRAVRVLAWGELARQIAHEIKNPLTPIRLGIQHLKRTHSDRSSDFEATLDRTARQILAEIERLDAIARAFARFGAPPAEAEPLATADLGAISRDTAGLYALADGPVVEVKEDGQILARVRKDEVKEVLINLIENARDAGATDINVLVGRDDMGAATLVVSDNGAGIAREVIPLIFEPQFSTTTSGTGLGLAICKRLVESWGGTIIVESELGHGSAVRIAIGT